MRAVVRDRYRDRPRLAEVPVPVARDGEVVVRVIATSLNTADLDLARGRPPVARIGSGLVRPRQSGLGLDVVGVVDAIGPGVTALRPGDTVWGDVFGTPGAFAERVRARPRSLAPLPAGVDPHVAACLPHSGVLALQAIDTGRGVRGGDRVLIVGAGGCVGPIAVQLATARGAEVTGVDLGERTDTVRLAGAHHVLDATATDCTRTGDRYDVIIDIAAHRTFHAYRRALAPGGGYVRIARDLAGFLTLAAFGGRRMRNVAWAPSRAADLATLATLVTDGRLVPVGDRTCTLDELPAELDRLARGATRGKVAVAVAADQDT